MVDSIVTRTFSIDYIYLDLIFILIWIIFLVKRRYWMPIIWGIIGWVVYIFVDYYLWHIVMGVRTYEGSINPFLFFLWFCFSPGFVQFSYVFVMFEKRNKHEIIFWTLLFYIGWTATGLLSQLFTINSDIIEVARNMNVANQRLSFSLLVVLNLIIGLYLIYKQKLRKEDLLYIFIIGTLVEFCLEFTLWISGIRIEQGEWSIVLMIINTLVEFNMGIVLMYLVWRVFKKSRDSKINPPLAWKDFPYIKTDFNLVSIIISNPEKRNTMIKQLKLLFIAENIISDIKYIYEVKPDDLNINLDLSELCKIVSLP